MDHLYRRSMGLPYDEEQVRRQVAQGVSGYTGDFDRSNGFELDGSDLYIVEAAESQDPRKTRLHDIEYELAMLMQERQPSDEAIEAALLLEVEKTMLTEEIAAEVIASNPRDTERLMVELIEKHHDRAEAIRDYLVTALMERGEHGQPIDVEMLAEATLLGDYIAEANPEETPQGLVRIAEAMHEAMMARYELNQVLGA